jgi:hypothetical protein
MAMGLDCVSSTQFDAYIVTGGVADAIGGNVEKWTSLDAGSTWAKVATLISGQFLDAQMVLAYNSNAKIVVAEFKGLGNWANRGCLYGDNGFIGKRIDN